MSTSISLFENNKVKVIALLLSTICGVSISPKYMFFFLTWPGAVLLLYCMRNVRLKYAIIGGFLSGLVSITIGQYEVMPFPIYIFIAFAVIGSLINLLPYLLDRFISPKVKGFQSTLFFPSLMVLIEYLSSFGSAGIWTSIANTQYQNEHLIQIASVTGMWGISFLIYWFAAVMVWAIDERSNLIKVKKGVLIFGAIFTAVIIFGATRKVVGHYNTPSHVRIAGISTNSLEFLEACYQGRFRKKIKLHADLSQSSPEFQEAYKAFAAFVENPNDPMFKTALERLEKSYDHLFLSSEQEALSGAKIILWAEGAALIVKEKENELLEKGRKFSKENKIYLLMSLGVIRPGKISPEKKWMENKTVFIGPDGRILNVYLKNKPVPGVEPSVAGDGRIPVVQTPYGNIAMAICYDADFPSLMKQLSKLKADILLLPSGDWKAIAPFHSYMAMFRGVENGCSVVRQVNNGTSLVTDPFGDQLASMDYFKSDRKVNVAEVPVKRVITVYSYIGDTFAYICMATVVLFIGISILEKSKSKKDKKYSVENASIVLE